MTHIIAFLSCVRTLVVIYALVKHADIFPSAFQGHMHAFQGRVHAFQGHVHAFRRAFQVHTDAL